jgi:hypothetical protein
MTWSMKQKVAFSIIVAALVTVVIVQHRTQAGVKAEQLSLQQQLLTLDYDNGRLSNQLAQAIHAPAAPVDYSAELMRLRGEAGVLRRQTNELQSRLVRSGNDRRQPPASDPDQVLAVLPEDYPPTPQAAARFVLDFFSQADPDGFFKYFGQPGAKQMFDQMIADERVKKMAGMKVISIGQPTNNSIAPEILMVPYKVRLRDGSEQERQLRLVQDPDTRRWFFKGGL